ncbi:hypothetical protein MKZ38_009033 [Zalerion maritima]|uniref:Uncharacterized protein n=1 Tax=Zalerion maritima TaxID=339359 RepID=A0AAD5RUH4_9PEZI|nr:hypothetical protein MKZ38_009033 [Zalerion maritima]
MVRETEHPDDRERDLTPADPAAAAESTYHSELVDDEGIITPELREEKPEASASAFTPSPPRSESGIGEEVKTEKEVAEKREELKVPDEMRRTKSAATDMSVTTRASTRGPPPESNKWFKTPNPLKWGAVPLVPEERAVSREYNAGFFSRLTFSWMAPLMNVGYRRPLEPNDIWTVNPDRACEGLTAKLTANFERRVKNGDKNPLLWAMHETFFREFWVGGMCNLFSTVMSVLSPFTLRFLIQFATDAYYASIQGLPAPGIGRGLGLAFGVTAMQICQSLAINHFLYRGMLVGGQVRGVLISMIFEKSMSLSERARAGGDGRKGGKEEAKKKKKKKPPKGPAAMMAAAMEGSGWSNGRIVNLMSVDTYRIDQASGMFHMVWTAPIMCLITLALLLVNLTYSALAGFALLVLGFPLLTRVIRSLFRRRKAINSVTDRRVGLTQEVLQNVRFVKYFGWESSFLTRLREIRATEIKHIQILLAMRNAINAVSLSLPVFASMLSFITYSLTSHDLAPAEVFSSLAMFNGLRLPLNLLPLVIGQIVDAWSSVERIEEFLLAEESEESARWEPEGQNAIELHDASFTWEKTQALKNLGASVEGQKTKGAGSPANKEPKPTEGSASRPISAEGQSSNGSTLVDDSEAVPFHISELNIAISRNELVAVIGSVGSGKSSLLAAMAGDMRKTAGEVVLGASRALCPQYAWIQNTTVRNNILFGKDMNRTWYKDVIEACALKQDMDMLPAGDMTEIGERGITISGGQKQRLNIARAIYFDADVVIMDDPLSAVDAHVGRHIFDNAILGLLKDKARILATHQLWVLSRCDRIVWMENGKIQAVDTFDNLMRDHAGFRSLLETTATEEKKEAEIEVNEDETAEDEKAIKKRKKAGGALMQAEERAIASIPWSTYAAYIRASGSILNAPLLILVLITAQGMNIVTSLWLSWWTGDKWGLSTGTYIGVYAGLGACQAIIMFIFSLGLTVLGTRASKHLLRIAVSRTLRAPMSFFDTTPLGRITNRFSRDVDVMDNTLSDAMRMYGFTLSMIISVFILIIAYFHWFAIALVPLFILFLFAASYYRSSAREVKRFESVLRSTVFAKFGEGLSGTACIKAYGLTGRFVKDLRKSIDEMNAAYYLTFSNQRWLSLRLDTIGNILVFTTAILVVTSRFDVPPYIGGLVLSYILAIVQMIQFTVRQLAEVENGMNAVERLLHYGTKLEEEAPLHTVDVRESWPEKGEIIFDHVQMRYRAGLPLVLKGLSIHVAGGERIGIVGRTGAGKSSIMSTLFRLVELDGGHITIDGIDISTIGLHDLRSRLAIIPQDPTLFKGTVRSNLDPFSKHTDLELWSALRQADLISEENDPNTNTSNRNNNQTPGTPVSPTPVGAPTQQQSQRIHLDSPVVEDGLNFSLGQRQLMALARALVRNSRIIVCDEATSSVDVETDDRIQKTMAKAFNGRTLLVIAHRLRTILGYDRICVLDAGRIAELGTPMELWGVDGGIFRSMCERSGIGEREVRLAMEGHAELMAGEEAGASSQIR